MKMNEFLTALQTHLNTQQSTNQNLLDLLYDAYNDTTGMDNVGKIKREGIFSLPYAQSNPQSSY